MLCFRDVTYCASPNCLNACGRKMTEEIKAEAKKQPYPISFANFCDSENMSNEDLQANIKRIMNATPK